MLFLRRSSITADPTAIPPAGGSVTVGFALASDRPTRFVTRYSLFADVPFSFTGATATDPDPEVKARVASPKEVEVTGRSATRDRRTFATALELRSSGPLRDNDELQVTIQAIELGEDGKSTGEPELGFSLISIGRGAGAAAPGPDPESEPEPEDRQES